MEKQSKFFVILNKILRIFKNTICFRRSSGGNAYRNGNNFQLLQNQNFVKVELSELESDPQYIVYTE